MFYLHQKQVNGIQKKSELCPQKLPGFRVSWNAGICSCAIVLYWKLHSQQLWCVTASPDHRCLKRNRCLPIHILTLHFFLSLFYPVCCTASLPCPHDCQLPSVMDFGLPAARYWTELKVQEQLGVGRSRQSYPAGTPALGEKECATWPWASTAKKAVSTDQRNSTMCE